jgi:hypothetical protein
MTLRSWTSVLAVALISGRAGWMLRGPSAVAPEPASAIPAATAETPATPGLSVLAYPPMAGPEGVTLYADGSVSLRVERRALAWVLAELCRQGAQLLACDGEAAVADAPAPAGSSPAQLEQSLRHASEQVRLHTLQEAQLSGVPVSEAVLMQLMRSDPSERVRLQAFEQLTALKAGSPEELRKVLQAALYIPSTALQARAREQLDQLDELQQQLATQQPGS